ncbi:MAG: type IV toxin-antitoxin system AbiEi family antitoxin, partial [Anaerovoracaceae bacterium]
TLPQSIFPVVFTPNLPTIQVKEVPVLAIESIIINMAASPSSVRSWQSAEEWLFEMAAELDSAQVLQELKGRKQTIVTRTGYLLQGLRPDIAKLIKKKYPTKTNTRFGPRSKSLRYDNSWHITDSILPFDPRELRP